MHNTMFDYMSASNGLQYLMALGFIAGFLILWEVLMSTRPFRALFSSIAEDLRFTRELGIGGVVAIAKSTVQAAVLVAVYLAAVPLLFAQGLGSAAFRGVSAGVSFGWSPIRAYFTGRKQGRRSNESKKSGE